jgi:aminobenzoyl-glutamate utilization protein B
MISSATVSALFPTLLACVAAPHAQAPQDAGPQWTPAKRTVVAAVDELAPRLTEASGRIWEFAELALNELRSSKLLADLLEGEGFEVERNVSGMPTAFVASYGQGKPVVAYLAEYDALPGLSQRVQPTQEAIESGGSGHGCGHNLFGSGSVGAGIALARAMREHDLSGTVRVYGTPAEEHGLGKVFLARDGRFDDVDACLSWHPSDENRVSVQPSKALRSFEVTFHGRSAHAAGAPWKGVSALDAVEAFCTGVNLLREHMPESARIHYVIIEGGDAPNVVPAQARVWAFTRGKDWPEEEQVFQHVEKIVEGADLMAWGEEHGDVEAGFRPAELVTLTGLYHYNPNQTAARCVHRNLDLVGPADYSEDEHAFARRLQTAFDVETDGMHDAVTPFDPEAPPESGGSTDVANVSWICPTIDLEVANWPRHIPAHSWASTAASGSTAGAKAMLTAAKVLAAAGVDVLSDPELVSAMRAEFELASKAFPYVSPVDADAPPRLPSHMRLPE